MGDRINCPHDGTKVEVEVPTGYGLRAVTAKYKKGPRTDRKKDRYLEVGCTKCDNSFWVFYR